MIIIGLLVDLKNEKNSCICDKCVICKSFLIWFCKGFSFYRCNCNGVGFLWNYICFYW